MEIYEYDTQEELDDAFENIERLNVEHLELKEKIKDLEEELEYAKQELVEFEEENNEFLVS